MTPGAPPSDHAIPMRPNEFVDAIHKKLKELPDDHTVAVFTGITIDGIHAATAGRTEESWNVEVHEQHEHIHEDIRASVELKHSS